MTEKSQQEAQLQPQPEQADAAKPSLQAQPAQSTQVDQPKLILLPKNTKILNRIKQDPMQRFRVYLDELIEADPEKGGERAAALYKRVCKLVNQSFAPDVLPVQGTPGNAMINERLDICVELILALVDYGWVATRIYDELPRLYVKQLREGEADVSSRNSWGHKEDIAVELDFSQDQTEENLS